MDSSHFSWFHVINNAYCPGIPKSAKYIIDSWRISKRALWEYYEQNHGKVGLGPFYFTIAYIIELSFPLFKFLIHTINNFPRSTYYKSNVDQMLYLLSILIVSFAVSSSNENSRWIRKNYRKSNKTSQLHSSCWRDKTRWWSDHPVGFPNEMPFAGLFCAPQS